MLPRSRNAEYCESLIANAEAGSLMIYELCWNWPGGSFCFLHYFCSSNNSCAAADEQTYVEFCPNRTPSSTSGRLITKQAQSHGPGIQHAGEHIFSNWYIWTARLSLCNADHPLLKPMGFFSCLCTPPCWSCDKPFLRGAYFMQHPSIVVTPSRQ